MQLEKLMKQRTLIAILVIVAAIIGLTLVSRLSRDRSSDVPVARGERILMGTNWQIQLPLEPASSRASALQAFEAAFDEISRIEAVMSEWRADTPISAVNNAAGEGLVSVPAELRSIVERGVAFGELTLGAFDITWRGMGDLWDLDGDFRPPTEAEIRPAIELVDFRRIQIEEDRVGLAVEGMAIGLGGIAKGYAIDRAAMVLRRHGFKDFLINGGGDVLAAGKRGATPWRVGIRDPRGNKDSLIGRVKISEGAVVTSGDYERYRIIDGVRYHHIIDPRTGRPAAKCQAVTVIAPSAEEADVLATAIFVLGHPPGIELAVKRQGTEALIIDAEGSFWMTEGFEKKTDFF
jgi:thiamine biosynthesis lipoprotein